MFYYYYNYAFARREYSKSAECGGKIGVRNYCVAYNAINSIIYS